MQQKHSREAGSDCEGASEQGKTRVAGKASDQVAIAGLVTAASLASLEMFWSKRSWARLKGGEGVPIGVSGPRLPGQSEAL
jgi:hypothetical protein